jgi:L-lactate dehydrogenase (cytochrome)
MSSADPFGRRAVNLHDIRLLARRRLPHMLFEYVDGASGDEATHRANLADFAAVELPQRVLRDVGTRDLSTTVLGQKLSMPLVIGPTGFAGLMRRNGEQIGARVAQEAGIAFCQSTVSIASVEQVRAAAPAPHWFQLYIFENRTLADDLIGRAEKAGCPVLVLTVDGAPQGRRDRDLRSGFIAVNRIGPRMLWDFAKRPSWFMDIARGGMPRLGSVAGLPGAGNDIISQAYFSARQTDLTLTWKDLAWLRQRWKGKLAVKGILDPEDARACLDHGVDGIIVSNHGGRQLDGARSTVRALPAIAEAVAGRADILIDGGVRRGQDIARAVQLGAQACLIGRPWLYGLAAGGADGVRRVIEILRADLDISLAFMGQTRIGR